MTQNEYLADRSVDERWNRVFRVLSSEPRRKLALSLRAVEPSEWVELPDAALSTHYDGTHDEMRVELRHKHLPLLEDAGYVRSRTVPLAASRGPEFDELDSVLGRLLSTPADLPDRLVHGCRALDEHADSPLD
jgi:hypothetical protein